MATEIIQPHQDPPHTLRWTAGDNSWYILNPDHPNHQQNMDSLSRMEKLILQAYLLETAKTVQQAIGKL